MLAVTNFQSLCFPVTYPVFGGVGVNVSSSSWLVRDGGKSQKNGKTTSLPPSFRVCSPHPSFRPSSPPCPFSALAALALSPNSPISVFGHVLTGRPYQRRKQILVHDGLTSCWLLSWQNLGAITLSRLEKQDFRCRPRYILLPNIRGSLGKAPNAKTQT